MPTVACSGCRTLVKVRGSAVKCPNCGRVVGKSPPGAPLEVPPAVDDLEELSEEAGVFRPTRAEDVPRGDNTKIAVGIGLSAVVVVALLIAWGTLHHAAPPPAGPVAGPWSQPIKPVAPPPLPDVAYVPFANTPAADSVPVAAPPTPTTTTVAPPAFPWSGLVAGAPQHPPAVLTDAVVFDSVHKGVEFLLKQIGKSNQVEYGGVTTLDATGEGQDALCVYALMHAGEAINDERLTKSSPFMQKLIRRMKELPMSGDKSTYDRSIRAAALATFNRPEDHRALADDFAWLLKAGYKGAYTYQPQPPQPPGAKMLGVNWDNSNSQYGALGVWAAGQAGIVAPISYWNEIEEHWSTFQDGDGGWTYQSRLETGSTLAMTAAGITMLCVAEDQREARTLRDHPTRPLYTESLKHALEWMDTGNNAVDAGAWRGYTLYGLERAALITGFKQFGQHDWYRELAQAQIARQRQDGCWDGGGAGPPVETAFNLLFLSRGAQPLLMNKLRFTGDWGNRPRDVPKLVEFISRQLERSFAWGLADVDRDWWGWLDTPVLLLTSDSAPDLTPAALDKLKQFALAGGLIVTHAENGDPYFAKWVEGVAKTIFPNYPLAPLPADHPLWSAVYRMTPETAPPVRAVSNGSRILLLDSPTDLTHSWVVNAASKDGSPQQQLAVNLYIYASGKGEIRNRLSSSYVAAPVEKPSGTLPVYRIRYDTGVWDPEPYAWTRFARQFQQDTNLAVDVRAAAPVDLRRAAAPVAFLTGNGAADFSDADAKAIHDYVSAGGVLVIDSCGGNQPFIQSVRGKLIPAAFPNADFAPLLGDHPVMSGLAADGKPAPCAEDCTHPHVRRIVTEQLGGQPPRIDCLAVDKGFLIVSDLDLTEGLLAANHLGIYGFTAPYAQSLVKNILLWSMARP